MGKLALNARLEDPQELLALAPFLSEKYLDALVDKLLEKGEVDMNAVSCLAPFLSAKTLRRIVQKLMARGDMDGIRDVTPFL